MPPEATGRASAVYTGSIVHQRRTPVGHEFRYRLSMLFLDLEELPHLEGLAPLWGYERRAPLSFRRRDHFGDPGVPLDACVRDLVEQRTGTRPAGPIRLLTSPRFFGYGFNPLSLYYCYDATGAEIESVVAEVTNTPWLEKHCYVLPVPASRRGQPVQSFRCPKELHVSPFLGMDYDYHWKLRMPGERLSVRIGDVREGREEFYAYMNLERQPLRRGALVRSMLHAPLGAVRVVAGIHLQAFRLWRKGVPYQPHPRCRRTQDQENQQPQDRERAISGHSGRPRACRESTDEHRSRAA